MLTEQVSLASHNIGRDIPRQCTLAQAQLAQSGDTRPGLSRLYSMPQWVPAVGAQALTSSFSRPRLSRFSGRILSNASRAAGGKPACHEGHVVSLRAFLTIRDAGTYITRTLGESVPRSLATFIPGFNAEPWIKHTRWSPPLARTTHVKK
jgi:hypothetical protein